MNLKLTPQILFPKDLDSNTNLYQVYNNSESKLLKSFHLSDDIIYIVPREWFTKPIWNFDNGIINVEGELIYYNDTEIEYYPNLQVELANNENYYGSIELFFENKYIDENIKNKYRRVIAFKKLTKISELPSRVHVVNEWVRGYVVAEHHNALKDALFGIEELIGIDNSQDHFSIDYRLKDMENLAVQEDDLNCPYGIYWYEVLEETDTYVKVQFHITIIGDYESYSFIPKKEADPITNNLNPIVIYSKSELETSRFESTNINDFNFGVSLTVKLGDCCACISENNAICEPCEFEPPLADIPLINCPIIEPWEIPSPPVIPCPPCTLKCPETVPCTEVPTVEPCPTIEVPSFAYTVDIKIPPIVVTIDSFTPPTWVLPTPPKEEEMATGACFKLVPCLGTTS
jgi:hypothetical protein